jgi:hypothetical protein
MSSPAPEEPYNDANGGEFEDDELRLLGKLHVDQSKWLPAYSSSVPINAGTKMLHDVYWTHRDVVFYADMNLFVAFLSLGLMIATKETYYRWFNPIMSAGPSQNQYNIYMILLFSNSFATFLQIFAIFGFVFISFIPFSFDSFNLYCFSVQVLSRFDSSRPSQYALLELSALVLAESASHSLLCRSFHLYLA